MNLNQKLELIQNSQLIVGIDIAKNTHIATIMSISGRELKVGIKVPNTRNGFQDLEKALQPYDPKKVIISMEPTGHYYKSLAYNFKKIGYPITLVNPYHTKLSKEIGTNNKSKNDVKDSRLIAKLTQEGKFCESLLLTGKYAELRKMTLVREQQVQGHTRTVLQLRTLLDEYLPEYDCIFRRIECITSISLLKTYGLERLRSEENMENKVKFIVTQAKGQIKKDRAEAAVKRLAESIGVIEGIKAAQIELEILLQHLALYKETLKITEQAIEKHLIDIPESKRLLEIKGVGPIMTGVILGQTGSFDKYTNAKQLEKLAGIAIAENESGKFKGKKRMNKRGRDVLRHGLYRIAMSLIVNNREFKQYYEYKVKILKKPKMIAITAVQTKFLKIIFGLIKNNIKYNGDFVMSGLSQI